uniref:WH2 domain-containing protein n=1 Tax=Ascaris lumbricoides TaxID=6252 RepID=A0A0M3ISI6_ASCLU
MRGASTWNQSNPSTPPTPKPCSRTRVIGTPAYKSSSPRSSQIDVINEAGLRIKPNSVQSPLPAPPSPAIFKRFR